MNDAGCEIGFELGDVLRVGTAPAVDSLVFVSDDRQVSGCGRAQQLQQAILHAVYIVVFVHKDMADVAVISFLHVGCLLKQDDGFPE